MIFKNQILHADCLDILKQLPDASVDLLLQDPPYNSTNCRWDYSIDLPTLWHEWRRVVKKNGCMVFTGTQPFSTDLIASNRKEFRYELIWEKSRAAGFLNANKMPLKTHENILVFYRSLPTYNPQKTVGKAYDKSKYNGRKYRNEVIGHHLKVQKLNGGDRFPVSILKFPQNWQKQKQLHPTQKPVELFRYLIRTFTQPNELVFDGYGGSGTTAAASILEGRNFIVCEKDEAFFEASVGRIKSLTP